MRMIAFRGLILAGTALLAACAQVPPAPATPQRKAGLWEVTTRLDFVGDPPRLPPEQLEQITQPLTTRVCVTPQQAAARDNPIYSGVSGCRLQNAKYAGATFSGDLLCDRPDMHGSGSVEAVFAGDENYSGRFHFAGTSQQLGAVAMDNRFSGRWLGSDCGDVKPVTPPP